MINNSFKSAANLNWSESQRNEEHPRMFSEMGRNPTDVEASKHFTYYPCLAGLRVWGALFWHPFSIYNGLQQNFLVSHTRIGLVP
ncbi:MAG: hypothetical protein AOA66_0600 [Candidatus Bathyarchaeota archaeon BA2]|nr:MAG: hypothetical protein AOA66_0600 [Candidatus Bathyarchaeota archaeon BA2]